MILLQAELKQIWESFGFDSWDYYEFSIHEAMNQAVAGANWHITLQAQPKKQNVYADRVQYEDKIFHIDGVVHQDLRNEYHMKHLGWPRSAYINDFFNSSPHLWTGPCNRELSPSHHLPNRPFLHLLNIAV